MSEFQLCISAEEPTIIVGDQAQSRNRIPFRIRIHNDGPVWLKMEIPVGESGLVRDQADAREIRARVSYPGMHSSHEDFRGEESDGCRSGWLGDGVDGIGVGENSKSRSTSRISSAMPKWGRLRSRFKPIIRSARR